ncbi:MAG: hypothetical protein AAFR45_02935 [Pseudomonadota bacterium]
MNEEVLATVHASPARRWFAIAMLIFVGGLMLYVAMSTPPALVWQVFLIVMGAAALWLAEQMRRATEHALELTETELRDTSGQVVVRIDDIAKVDRGLFAFKPSNGFLVITRPRPGAVWRPGLWWRIGRRIGVGGVTPAAQTKFMAEILTAKIMNVDLQP